MNFKTLLIIISNVILAQKNALYSQVNLSLLIIILLKAQQISIFLIILKILKLIYPILKLFIDFFYGVRMFHYF